MRVVIRTDYENSYEPRCFTEKAFIKYANDMVKMDDSNEKFQFTEDNLNDAISYVSDSWGFTIDVLEVEGFEGEE